MLLTMLFNDDLIMSPTHELIFIFSYFAYFRNVIAHILVIERLNATLSFRKYERSRGPCFTFGWLFFVNLLTFGTVYGTSTTSSTTFINLCFWAIMFVLAILELIAIKSMKKYNDQIYTSRSFINATLSERYQVIGSSQLLNFFFLAGRKYQNNQTTNTHFGHSLFQYCFGNFC
ncbi:unnamed protein product [Meloidogyne enterolobii]|uniref:Uncharacterized protein n=1 Tax=Meloidogyne enterolobii TaxID=390850 RepID=A0ACB1B222_MELEN